MIRSTITAAVLTAAVLSIPSIASADEVAPCGDTATVRTVLMDQSAQIVQLQNKVKRLRTARWVRNHPGSRGIPLTVR